MSVLASGAVVLIYNPVALATVYGDQVRAASAGGVSMLAKPTAPMHRKALTSSMLFGAPARFHDSGGGRFHHGSSCDAAFGCGSAKVTGCRWLPMACRRWSVCRKSGLPWFPSPTSKCPLHGWF